MTVINLVKKHDYQDKGIRFNGENADDILRFAGNDAWYGYGYSSDIEKTLEIKTKHLGATRVRVGDWVIFSCCGFAVISQKLFDLIYEELNMEV